MNKSFEQLKYEATGKTDWNEQQTKKQLLKSEDALQSECFKWANNNYCLKIHDPRCRIFSVPNGGLRNKIEAMKLQATGLTAGVSDMIALFPNGRCVFFETKIEKGKQSDVQKEFEQSVLKLGFNYELFYTFEEFKAKFTKYL